MTSTFAVLITFIVIALPFIIVGMTMFLIGRNQQKFHREEMRKENRLLEQNEVIIAKLDQLLNK